MSCKHEDSHLQTKERSLNHILPSHWMNQHPNTDLGPFSFQNCWITNCSYLSHQFVVLCYSIPSMAILTPLFLTLHMHSFRKSSWLLLQNLSRIWPLLIPFLQLLLKSKSSSNLTSMAIVTPLFLTLHMHTFRKSSWLLLQNLSSIWPLLTISIVTTQIQVIIQSIISCLGYCDSFLTGLSAFTSTSKFFSTSST